MFRHKNIKKHIANFGANSKNVKYLNSKVMMKTVF